MMLKKIAHVICYALDACLCDNDFMSCFKILSPTNMPSGQVGLHNWCISELDTFVGPLWVDRSHGNFELAHLVDEATCKHDFSL